MTEDRDFSPCMRALEGFVGTGAIGVEIGIWDGGNAGKALHYLCPQKYYMIDPYVEYSDNDFPQSKFDEMYEDVRNKFQSFPNACLMRVSSLEASRSIMDELDFVYIDGAHDYANKIQDLAAWYPKIRNGGILCGDDFNIPTVAQAVEDFTKKMGLSYWVSNNSDPHPPEFCIMRMPNGHMGNAGI